MNKTKRKLYGIWYMMKHRCFNKDSHAFDRYGGRGITVCARWVESLDNFIKDMGPRPASTSLDRIDNHGDYKPGNCRWATQSQQTRNTRASRMLTYKGETYCMAEWAERLNLSQDIIESRLNRYKWSVKRALSTPLMEDANVNTKVFIAHGGIRLCMSDWERKLGISSQLIRWRIKRGWSIKDALDTPKKVYKKHK